MTDTNRESEAPRARRVPAKGRPELLIAFIEHGSRPAAMLVMGLLLVGWLFSVDEPLLQLLSRAQSLKVGSLELELRETATRAGVGAELEALRALNDKQLQLFLIIGKSRPHINYQGEEVTEENLRKLQEVGIVEEWRTEEEGGFWWKVSDEGHRLHDIVRNLIFASIRRSGVV